MRGSDPDAAIYWLARMLEAGEDPRFIARRIVILASEDVGNADPQALMVATAAWHAVEFVGLPECQLNLAQAVIYLATAPKSNSATVAIGAAREDVAKGRTIPVPKHLRDAITRGPSNSATASATNTPTKAKAATSPRTTSAWTRPTTNRRTAATKRRSRSGWRNGSGGRRRKGVGDDGGGVAGLHRSRSQCCTSSEKGQRPKAAAALLRLLPRGLARS